MGTKIDKLDQIGLNRIKVDLIGPNRNCLILGRTNNYQKTLEKKLYVILQLKKIIIYSHHALRGFATSFINFKTEFPLQICLNSKVVLGLLGDTWKTLKHS